MTAGGSKKQVRRTSTGRIRKLDLRSNEFIWFLKGIVDYKNDYRIFLFGWTFPLTQIFLSQTHDVIGVLVHPHYSPFSLDYNVALLKLSSPLNLSESTQPVCLPSAGQEITPFLHCWAPVWTSQMCTSPVFCLHKLTVVMVHNSLAVADIRVCVQTFHDYLLNALQADLVFNFQSLNVTWTTLLKHHFNFSVAHFEL